VLLDACNQRNARSMVRMEPALAPHNQATPTSLASSRRRSTIGVKSLRTGMSSKKAATSTSQFATDSRDV